MSNVRYEYEGGDPSPEHIELRRELARNAVDGAGPDGIPVTRGMLIEALKDNIIEYQPFGVQGYVQRGTILEIGFSDALGYPHCKVINGGGYTWRWNTRITIYLTVFCIAPKRENGSICGVTRRDEVMLNNRGGYTDGGGPYTFGSVNPELWAIK